MLSGKAVVAAATKQKANGRIHRLKNDLVKNYFASLALNSSLIFSISTALATGLKFWVFRDVLLRADFPLSLRFFLFKRVTDITLSFKGCKNKQVLQFTATDSQIISISL